MGEMEETDLARLLEGGGRRESFKEASHRKVEVEKGGLEEDRVCEYLAQQLLRRGDPELLFSAERRQPTGHRCALEEPAQPSGGNNWLVRDDERLTGRVEGSIPEREHGAADAPAPEGHPRRPLPVVLSLFRRRDA